MKQGVEKARRGRPKLERPMRRINVSVDPRDYEEFERLAGANNIPAAQLIRLAMKHYLRGKRGKNVLVA